MLAVTNLICVLATTTKIERKKDSKLYVHYWERPILRGEKREKLLGKRSKLSGTVRETRKTKCRTNKQTNRCRNSKCLTDPQWNQPNQPQTNTHTPKERQSHCQISFITQIHSKISSVLYVRYVKSDFLSKRVRIPFTHTKTHTH